jgi:hypothetical protein
VRRSNHGLRRRVQLDEGAPAPVGVALQVDGKERGQVKAAPRIDQLDARQVPAGNVHGGAQQRAIGGGNLIANAGEGKGAVAAALLAGDLHAEDTPELVTRWAGAAHSRACEPAVEWGLAGLIVYTTVVLLLDPGLGGAVEQLESELGFALEHGHEPSLHLRPEDLLFAILLGCLRQGCVVLYGKALESTTGLGGDHRSTVVAQ